MKRHTKWGGLVLSLLLTTGLQAQQIPADLSREIVIDDSTLAASGLEPRDRPLIEEPINDWREKSVEYLQNPGATADELYEHLLSGVHFKSESYDLPSDFVRTLTDEKIGELFERTLDKKEERPTALRARLEVTDSILERPTMEALHGKAHYHRAVAIYMTTTDTGERLACFQEAANAITNDAEHRERAESAARAARMPELPLDYEVGPELMDVALQYKNRVALFRLSSAGVISLDRGPVDTYHPANFGGDVRPLLGAARYAFEVARGEDLSRFVEIAKNVQLETDQEAQIRYFKALDDFASSRYEEAIQGFQEIADFSENTEHVVWSVYRLAESYKLNRDYVKAAVHYLEAEARADSFPDAALWSRNAFKFLVDGGFVQQDVALANFGQFVRVKKQEVSMADTDSVSRGSK